jgi:hypothetical protein
MNAGKVDTTKPLWKRNGLFVTGEQGAALVERAQPGSSFAAVLANEW